MTKPHIAVFVLPAATLVYPMLSIISTLVRRGYRVTGVTSERYSNELKRLGVETLNIPSGLKAPDLAEPTLAAASSFYEANRPSLVLHDPFSVAALVVAARLGIPNIRATTELALDEKNLDRPDVPQKFREQIRGYLKLANRFLHTHGYHRYDDVVYDRAIPTIYLYVSDLQLNESEADRNSIYAGRCAAERPCKEPWRRRSNDSEPTVLIYASSSAPIPPQYYKECLNAVSEMGWNTIVVPQRNTEAMSLGPLPPRSEIVQDVPLLLIMPHVDMMICHGGMTTTTEAMYHGLPLLMLTNGIDEQEFYAENAQNHGIAIHLPGDSATSEDIKRRLVMMSKDEAMHASVKTMQDKVKRSAGAEEAVNWIEQSL